MEMFEDSSASAPKAYVSLANKYRPQTFAEVVGQDSVSKTLMNAIKSGRIAHAYLFYGPRGCGKTTTARLLAKALNCTGGGNNKPTDKPCGKCPQCLEIASSCDMDVLELDAASNTQVEKVREAIIDTVALASGRDRYKVFILDEVHMLSTSSFNALLKTIEEPPSHVVFILATTELNKVPLTISSRCQTFRFKPIKEEEISSRLLDLADAEDIKLSEEAASLIAKSAGGALRDALTIFDRAISFSDGKVDKALVSQMLGVLPDDLIKNSAEALIRQDGALLHKVFEKVKEEGFDALSLLKDLKTAFGEMFYLSLNAGKEPFDGAKDLLKECSSGYIAGLTRKISKLTDEVKLSDTQALAAEVGLFTIMQNSVDIGGLISRLEALENGSASSFSEKKSLNDPFPIKKEAENTVAPVAVNVKKEEPSPNVSPAHAAVKSFSAEPIADLKETFSAKNENSVSASADSVLPKPNIKSFSSALEVWPLFKEELEKSYPFLSELLFSAKADFISKNEWEFSFSAKDGLFKESLQRRISDLEKTAFQVCGEKIKFTFKTVIGPKQTFEPVRKEIYPKRPALPAAKEAKTEIKAQPVPAEISEEEPFIEGDFSAYVKAETEKKDISVENIGPKTREVLELFEGDLVEKII